MSRIDEAWNRAACGPDERPGAAASKRDLTAVHAEEFTLAHYPRERTPAPAELDAAGDTERIVLRQVLEEPLRGVVERAQPALAALPVAGRRRQSVAAVPERLVVRADAALVEQYHRLSLVLAEQREKRECRTLVITSAIAGEGKTTTALNLALTLGHEGARVLLVDANLRRPSLHDVLGIRNDVGLAEEVHAPEAEPVGLDLTPVLSVLTAGQPGADPIPVLTSHGMRTLLERRTNAFDFVLVDAPHVGTQPDAVRLARLCHGVLFVIGADTPFPVVATALNAVGRASVIGTILNAAAQDSTPAPPTR
jgi:non-specific protein-tyrosine kinase